MRLRCVPALFGPTSDDPQLPAPNLFSSALIAVAGLWPSCRGEFHRVECATHNLRYSRRQGEPARGAYAAIFISRGAMLARYAADTWRSLFRMLPPLNGMPAASRSAIKLAVLSSNAFQSGVRRSFLFHFRRSSAVTSGFGLRFAYGCGCEYGYSGPGSHSNGCPVTCVNGCET